MAPVMLTKSSNPKLDNFADSTINLASASTVPLAKDNTEVRKHRNTNTRVWSELRDALKNVSKAGRGSKNKESALDATVVRDSTRSHESAIPG